MGAIINSQLKKKYLEYIQTNFKKYSQRKLARNLGIGKTTVNRWSKEIGLKFKKHSVNDAFFDKLNETSVYILGFIIADGSIAFNPIKGYYSLTITAASKDKNHLEKMRKIMEITKPLLYSPKTNSYRLIANSKKLAKKLISIGITPRKTFTARFPKIPKNLIKHFIRGIIDGDGNVRYVKREKSPYFEITISSGSIEFLEDFIYSVNKSINIKANIRKIGTNTYSIQYSCSRGKKLAKFIYSNSNIFLERKYLPYKENVLGGKKNE